MIELIGEVLPYAVVVALSPGKVIAALLLLAAPVGLRGAALFAGARLLTLSLLVAIFAAAIDVIDLSAGSTWPAAVAKLLLGVVLIVVAVRKWLTRPRDAGERTPPAWMHSIDAMGPWASLRLGVILTAANPKELAMAVAAGLVIGGSAYDPAAMVVGGVVFVFVATLGTTIPVAVAAIGGRRVATLLTAARDWFVQNSSTIVTIGLLVIGTLLLGNGIAHLAELSAN